ncbi:hypothetical protein I2I05_08490 [Hymenobacter sp. BT683]|uniref:DUF3098 domain-containing protein n=1 Tax=Hymenobacter jeongseonensis TaxID=2791027 RepID=A0ABS0IGE5_9BACT|nr:hypothetical protein [Hymenobacter jeongseonensis]MBF9237434.1 hypothetical protein [Hymenobacter jeongseonensis]
MKHLKNPYIFFAALAVCFVFVWQFNNLFNISGDTDGFARLGALVVPLGILVALKIRAESQQ